MDITPSKGNGWGKAVRLRKHAQFCRVQSQGRRIGGKFLLVIFAPCSILGVRFGLTVSKRVGNAVTRNKVKRRLREILRHEKSAFPFFDVVVIAKPQAAQASFSALKQDVLSLMKRVPRS